MGVGDREYMKGGRRSHWGRLSDGGPFPSWTIIAAVVIGAGLLIWRIATMRKGGEDEFASRSERELTMHRVKVPAGKFEVKSGRLALADPDLSVEAVRAGKLALEVPALEGAWSADAIRMTFRVPDEHSAAPDYGTLTELRAWADAAGDPDQLTWTAGGEIEVHGRVCGIYDAETFRQDSLITDAFHWEHPPADPFQKWRSACLERSKGPEQCGTLPGGAVIAAHRGRFKTLISRTGDGKANGARIIVNEFDPEEFGFD
jgi:hypothetical protein